MDPCGALFRRFSFVLERGWRQCVLDLARRLVGATSGDVNGHVRSAKGAAEVGDVPHYFPKEEALFTIRQTLLNRARIDVVKGDPLENVLGRIPKHDNGGASRLADNFPVVTQQPARRPRNDAIVAVLPSENLLQGLRRRAAEIARRQVTALKTFDRCFEETLDFDVQVKKRRSRRPASRAPTVVLPTQLTPARNMRMLQHSMRVVPQLIEPAMIGDSHRSWAGLSIGSVHGADRDRRASTGSRAIKRRLGRGFGGASPRTRARAGTNSRGFAWLVLAPRRSAIVHAKRT
jgi:hypothetical protein